MTITCIDVRSDLQQYFDNLNPATVSHCLYQRCIPIPIHSLDLSSTFDQ